MLYLHRNVLFFFQVLTLFSMLGANKKQKNIRLNGEYFDCNSLEILKIPKKRCFLNILKLHVMLKKLDAKHTVFEIQKKKQLVY